MATQLKMVPVYYLGGLADPAKKPSFTVTVGDRVYIVKNEFGAKVDIPQPFVKDFLRTHFVVNKKGMFHSFTDNPKIVKAIVEAREGKKNAPKETPNYTKEQLLEMLGNLPDEEAKK